MYDVKFTFTVLGRKKSQLVQFIRMDSLLVFRGLLVFGIWKITLGGYASRMLRKSGRAARRRGQVSHKRRIKK